DPGLRAKHRESWIFENDYMDIEVIQKSKPITEYHAEIQTILDEYTGKIVAWNSQFDFKFLRYTKFKLGTPTIDPMKASTKFFKLPHKNGGCCKWPSAQEAWDHLFPDEPQIELHRGLADAFMEARIIHRLITMGVYKM
ncbi:MAG: hypothetical protein KAH25_12795, partial [Bacteroidales bacterium]|nr:hypothetical protein [Bacteroidales bacterium]